VYNLQGKAFNACVKDFEKPFLSQNEKHCVEAYTKKYLATIQSSVIYFSKRIVDFDEI